MTSLKYDEYLDFLIHRKEYTAKINEVASHIYLRAQQIRLEMLGYAWGPANSLTGPYFPSKEINEKPWYEPMFNNEEVVVNYMRGGMMTFPSKWLGDPNWEDEVREIYKQEQQKILLQKLEK